MTRVMLFSSDCHAGLRTDAYGSYIEEQYLPDLRDYLAAEAERERIGGLGFSGKEKSAAAESVRRDQERRMTFATELEARVPALEADGFVGEVLFPDSTSRNEVPFADFGGGVSSYSEELHRAALRAYNRWLGATSLPDRQLGLALIPVRDGDYARQEVERARGLGLRGVMPQWDGASTESPKLYSEALDPFWSACEEQDLPVNFHSGSGMPSWLYTRQTAADKMTYQFEVMFWCRRPLWHLIFGGVLERHPRLKVGFVEMYGDWIPRTLEFMEWRWRTRGDDALMQLCPRSPQEYWAQNCFVGAHAASRHENEMASAEFPEGTFTYGTDFPHPGSPWGCSNEFLQATVGASGASEADARAFLGGNVARIYGVDVERLAPVVEQVGPTVEDILDVPEGRDPSEVLPEFIRARVSRPVSAL